MIDWREDLRPYQVEDVMYLMPFDTCCCFNEQRTGKTPTALAWATAKGANKILIITTNTSILQWKEQFEKWRKQPCTALVENSREKKSQKIAQWQEGGLVISYDSFKSSKFLDGFIDEILAKKPDCLILDEAHHIRNRVTATAKSVFKCARIPYRIALTGTPAVGKADDIWAILKFVRPKEFSSYWAFIEQYFSTENINMGSKRFIKVKGFKQCMEEVLQKQIAQFSTNRKRTDPDVMPWLPLKDADAVYLELTNEQKHYLKELEMFFETEHINTKGILDRLIRYRQICLAPEILDLKGNSPKIDWIKEYDKEFQDRPTIIFSKSTKFLNILKNYYKDNAGIITGKVNVVQRNNYIQDFQTRKINRLLINIDAGKEALTLDTAECIIFTDLYPPAGDITQAEDRFVATTKNKADKLHIIKYLIMKDSYDEVLYELVGKRKVEIDIINNYKEYLQERRKKYGNSRKKLPKIEKTSL